MSPKQKIKTVVASKNDSEIIKHLLRYLLEKVTVHNYNHKGKTAT